MDTYEMLGLTPAILAVGLIMGWVLNLVKSFFDWLERKM